jgi:hypothetical protein
MLGEYLPIFVVLVDIIVEIADPFLNSLILPFK